MVASGPALKPYGEELIDSMPLATCSCVLDAGTGVGSLLPALTKIAPGARIVGVDVSIGMLRRARGGFALSAMDLRRLGFRDSTFDAVIAPFVLFHVPDPRDAVHELRRVLRPGGIIGIITWDGEPDFPAQRAWNEELQRYCGKSAVPDLVDHAPLSTPTKLRALLEAEGFMGVRTWDSPFDHAYTPESFLTLRTGLGTGRERFMSLSLRDRRAVLDNVRRRFDSMAPEDFVDATCALLATALK